MADMTDLERRLKAATNGCEGAIMNRHHLLLASVAIALLLSATTAVTQGVSARAQTAPGAATDVNAMRQQILALERRVAELEKARVLVSGKPAEASTAQDSRMAEFEQRLSGIQKSVDTLRTAMAAKSAAPAQASQTVVTAPFVVTDRAGKTLFRVQEQDATTSRGIYIHDDAGPVAHLGVNRVGGGRVYVVTHGSLMKPTAVLAATPMEGTYIALKDSKQRRYVQLDELGFTYYNSSDQPVVKLGSGNGLAGFLQIADKNGVAAVEAGTTKDGRSVVRVFPNDGRTPIPWPQFLMGGKP